MAEGRHFGMKVLCITICIILLQQFLAISFAQEETGSGFGFTSIQSVKGDGFTSIRSCLITDPEVLHSHSSGSGSYNHESITQLINFTTKDPARGFTSYGRNIEIQENTSFAYTPRSINMGSFKSGQIKSLWSDATKTGNSGGAFIELGFADTKVLSKNVHAKTSGFEDLEDIQASSGSFNAGMKFDVAFTGTEKLGVWLKGNSDKTPTRLMDEYYIGTFRIIKNVGLSSIGKKRTEDMNDALNCTCFKGYDSWDLADLKWSSHSVKDFFNCTSC
jgi:hypothetical protein